MYEVNVRCVIERLTMMSSCVTEGARLEMVTR